MKLCVDCRHFLAPADCDGLPLCKLTAKQSPVDGKHSYHHCAGERSNTGNCGPQGELYKERMGTND